MSGLAAFSDAQKSLTRHMEDDKVETLMYVYLIDFKDKF
jgi:hypothetical protein